MRYFINEDINDDTIVVENKEYKIKHKSNKLDIVNDVETSHKMLNHDLGNLTEKWLSREEIIEKLKKIPSTANYKFDKYSTPQLARILQRAESRHAEIDEIEKEAKETFKAWEETEDDKCLECGERLNDSGRCPICDEHNQDYIDIKRENDLSESVANMSDEEWEAIHDAFDAHRGELEEAEREAWIYAFNDSGAYYDEDTHLSRFKTEIEKLFKRYIVDTIRDILFEANLVENTADIPDSDLIKELDIDVSDEMPEWLEEYAWDAMEREKSNKGFDESCKSNLEEAMKLKEANETYLNNKWNERSQKVIDKYKSVLNLESIPLEEDLVDWAVSDCCVKYNECKDNVLEMLNGARGK